MGTAALSDGDYIHAVMGSAGALRHFVQPILTPNLLGQPDCRVSFRGHSQYLMSLQLTGHTLTSMCVHCRSHPRRRCDPSAQFHRAVSISSRDLTSVMVSSHSVRGES